MDEPTVTLKQDEEWQEEPADATEHAMGVDFDGEANDGAVALVPPPVEPTVEPKKSSQGGADVSLDVATGVSLAAGLGFTFYSILTAFQGESIYPLGILGIGLLGIAMYLRSK